MGIWVPIRKYREEDNSYFYKLLSLDGKQIVAYMKIEPLKNKISYSTCAGFTHVDSEIDMNDPNAMVWSIPGVDYVIISKSFRKAVYAIRDNYFPESMDHCS